MVGSAAAGSAVGSAAIGSAVGSAAAGSAVGSAAIGSAVGSAAAGSAVGSAAIGSTVGSDTGLSETALGFLTSLTFLASSIDPGFSRPPRIVFLCNRASRPFFLFLNVLPVEEAFLRLLDCFFFLVCILDLRILDNLPLVNFMIILLYNRYIIFLYNDIIV